MDLNPLPFYTRGRVVVIGDAVSLYDISLSPSVTSAPKAHAAVPYVGAGAAFAIEVSTSSDSVTPSFLPFPSHHFCPSFLSHHPLDLPIPPMPSFSSSHAKKR